MVAFTLGFCLSLSRKCELMATVVLQYAGAAIGTFLGGPIGGAIGRAVGGIAGSLIDQQIFGSSTHHEGPRVNDLRVMDSQEGAAIPVVYGRMRVAGQVIWATNMLEVAATATQSATGKGGPSNTSTSYSYFANFAVGLCEGEIDGIGRCWADGKEIDLSQYSPRIYLGTQIQAPDSLITAIETSPPAYRGLAYVVFERLPLEKFGNRLPQLSFEIFAKGNDVASTVKAINIIPGASEFGYDTALVTRNAGVGSTALENTHVSASRSDFSISMDQLQSACKNVGYASLVVSWFGSDLNCGTCQLRPGVENTGKITTGAEWMVSGQARTSAYQVSQVGGQPAYGGTPSDASVIRAIQDLKSRGLKVMFYPFILMDIPTYPWRGRITGTGDRTAAAATQIANFVGTATPAQFTIATDTVNFAGSEWSYRRMILHYAKLCALAGGVDGFLIGSELRGLTTLRASASSYPFVSALQVLAADVKNILPATQISYAADGTEYFGHQPQDGTGDVYFHLDPLWASPNIDFVGIDNYLPLSDWRDGSAHLELVAGTRSIYDQAYLQSRISGGENYDWFYANGSNRDAQIRTTISDGAYNKPWVFRPKDFKNWWSNTHINRPLGVESVATAWVPQSKPIWFTELGCPAVDKGANQPNVFVDAKSIENGLPYFSGGQQDTQIQQAFMKATQNYWSAPGAQNPVSNIYNAPMVDATKLFYWCWDARPFPAFPARTDVWSDGANYERGHWLNGRIGIVDLASLITKIAARFGFCDVDVSAVEGLVDGFVLDRPMSARDALEALLQVFAIDSFESEGKLKFISRRTNSETVVNAGDLIEDVNDVAIIAQNRTQETDLPAAIHIGYSESGLDYRQAAITQQRNGTASKREISLNIPAALSQQVAQARGDVALAEAWANRETAQFALSPNFEWVEPSDILKIGKNRWRVKTIQAGEFRKVEAVAHDAAVYDPPPAVDRLLGATAPAIFGQPDVLMMDVAMLDVNASPAPWVAGQATPWPGALALFKKNGSSSLAFNRLITNQATMGTTQNVLNAGLPHRIDYNQTLVVKLKQGALSSVSKDELYSGKNLALIGTSATGYEVVQFLTANLTAANTYRVTGFLRAQAGSEAEMLATRPAGQDFILLNQAVVQPILSLAEVGQGSTWRVGPSQLDAGSPAYLEIIFSGNLKALRPLPPAHIKLARDASGILFSWVRRTRTDGDSWELNEVPLGETAESYKLDILNGASVVRSVTSTAPNFLYTTANIQADFGTMPASFTLRVAQISAVVGAGTILERTLYV
jgi:GTA TIM-barrel-like domain/Putative phage tail protein